MGKPLKVLLVEDVEQDALLVIRELKRGGFDVTHRRVDTPEAMADALRSESWDLILSDYSMPRFSAPLALQVLKERNHDIPFIIVSGTVNEDIAVEAMHAGAHDFMAKGKLNRLIPAIERELRESAVRAEQKRLQDQLMISDRMASMGTLAAGVAHEINNPLACVMANLDLAARDVSARAEKLGLSAEFGQVREELHDAREAVERIRDIVRDLKIFSRAQDDTTGPIDVSRVLDSTLRMAWTEIRHRARLEKSYGHTPPVQASESRLGQVFLNVIVNSAQAIAEGRNEDNEIRVSTYTAVNGFVVVEISDTGPGMTQDVVDKLFTPFFTTKPVGVGTGLGLSICHRIVTSIGGTIEVTSEIGKGSTFRISLPPATAPLSDELPHAVHEVTPRKRGRVLVVDDEPMIAKIVQRILSRDHDVVATVSGEEALGWITAGERYDVILSDLMMPQMTGMELHRRLAELDQTLADSVIFVTGGAFTLSARVFLDGVPNQRVEKPFAAQHLRALVNDRIA